MQYILQRLNLFLRIIILKNFITLFLIFGGHSFYKLTALIFCLILPIFQQCAGVLIAVFRFWASANFNHYN